MNTVQKIIDLFGGLHVLRRKPIRVEVTGFMPLVIEFVGHGPRGYPLVSVAHYFTQHGDLMTDPDMTFELSPIDGWLPVSFQQASPPIYQEAVRQDENGKAVINPKLVKELTTFARFWDRNIKSQGFLKAARRQNRDVDPH